MLPAILNKFLNQLPQTNSCMAAYLLSQKPYKKYEPNIRETAEEARMNS